jgi:hypothetical protein
LIDVSYGFPPIVQVNALGVALLWISMLRYVEHNQTYFSVVLTLRRGVPRVMRYLIGVFPIFLAYTVFAVVYFGPTTSRFSTFQDAIVALFSGQYPPSPRPLLSASPLQMHTHCCSSAALLSV